MYNTVGTSPSPYSRWTGNCGAGLIEIASGAKSYTLAEVSAMTRNFNTQIGEGGFGPVYYGRLTDGHEVAVKVADGSPGPGLREFFNDVCS